ncbi:MAG TPA: ABC transporter permease [Vicinamibacterales bacterium]|jgi:putative ABC transport system permease protein|nr:ABC transporter permease [Vicinamibacterales bacterium]
MSWLNDLGRDVLSARRVLARNRMFTLIAVVTVALGIGANTAIFSVVHSVLLRPLPYKDADRIVGLYYHQPVEESPNGVPRRLRVGLSVANLIELRQRTRAISHAGASTLSFMIMTGGEETTRLEGARMSPAMFQMRGVRPLLGRVFDETDEALGADPVVILSHATWRRYFGADPNVVGRTVTLDDVFARVPPSSERVPARDRRRPFSIVGVMPETFEAGGPNQFWIPFGLTASATAPRGNLVARLADGVSPAAAAAEVGAIVREMHARGQPARPSTAQGAGRYEFVRQQDEIVAPVKPALFVLMAAVGFVLLIACVNVANLVFARTASREREIAIRIAIGAGRGRVVRQLLTECLVLALLGGAAGTALAFGAIRLLRSIGTTLPRMDLGIQLPFPRLHEISVDATVLAFTIAASLLTGVICGLAPALRYSAAVRLDTLRSLSPRSRVRGLLIAAEVAMAIVLLVGGGLLIHSFVKLSTVDLGYDPSNVLTFQVGLPWERYSNVQLRTFAENLIERLRSVPGVQGAAYGRQLPFVAITETFWFRRTPELADPPPPPDPAKSTDARVVSQDYLRVMGILVIAGRGFNEGDGPNAARVMLINEAVVRRDFPGENPVGQFVFAGRDSIPWQIVGIIRDVRQAGQDQAPRPQFFADYRQWPESDRVMFTFLGPYYALRVDGDTGLVVSQVRAVARQLDPQAGLFNVASMDQLVANRISRPRMYAVLTGIFAAVAVALAAIGIYGALTHSVAQRTREIGIRMALGAHRAEVMRLVLRQSLLWTVAGIAVGLAGASALARYLSGMLFGVTPLDPATFVAVSALFALIAMFASYVPARRATRVDPIIALRCE